jgi:hypothetical protein
VYGRTTACPATVAEQTLANIVSGECVGDLSQERCSKLSLIRVPVNPDRKVENADTWDLGARGLSDYVEGNRRD